MFDFELDPPSAFTNSYLDIKFIITLDNYASEVSVELTNQTTKEKLNIVGVLNGFISGDTRAVAKNSNKVEGFINIFNKDKMNVNLSKFASVDIAASVTVNGHTETKAITFYNQSKSLDTCVLPFNISISEKVDIVNHHPLKMVFTSGRQAKHELCIKSDNLENKCTFEVVLKNGVTEIEIPSEVLWHDLGLEHGLNGPYQIYFVKLEGINYNKVMNRTYVPIPNTIINFIGNKMTPTVQSRLDPIGNVMTQEFVISDRYFVHTHKDYTQLSGLSNVSGPRLRYLSMFMHESQNMSLVDNLVSTFDAKTNNRTEAKKTIRQQGLKTKSDIEINQQLFFQTFSHTQSMPEQKKNTVPKSTVPPKPSGCGCARKK